MVYDALAQRYGWTVQQIDDTPATLVLAMMTVATVRNEVEEDEARRRAAQANARQR